MKRPGVRRRGERRRHRQRRSRRRAGAQVIFASSGGAGYGECSGPADEHAPVPAALAVRDREEVRRGVPRRLEPDPRHAPRRRSASRTSTGRARTRGSRAASSRSSSSAWRAATRRSSSATARQSRDFVYVGDIVDALLAAVGRGGGPYNVGTGERRRRRRSARAPAPRRGQSTRAPRLEQARLGDVRRSVLDASLIERELGWRAAGRSTTALRRPGRGCRKQAARVAKRAAPWTRRSRTRRLSAPGGRRRSSRASSPRSSSSLLLGAALLLLAKPLSHAMQRHAEAAALAPREARSRRTRHEGEARAPSGQAEARARADGRPRPERQRPHRRRRGGAAKLAVARLPRPAHRNAQRQDYATTVVMYRPGRGRGAPARARPAREGRRPARRAHAAARCTAAARARARRRLALS